MRVRIAASALANSVYINVQANMAAGARRINMCILFNQSQSLIRAISPFPQFILNQYQEEDQKRTHTAKPKKMESMHVSMHSPRGAISFQLC